MDAHSSVVRFGCGSKRERGERERYAAALVCEEGEHRGTQGYYTLSHTASSSFVITKGRFAARAEDAFSLFAFQKTSVRLLTADLSLR